MNIRRVRRLRGRPQRECRDVGFTNGSLARVVCIIATKCDRAVHPVAPFERFNVSLKTSLNAT